MTDSPPDTGEPAATGASSAGPLDQLMGLLALVDPIDLAARAVDTGRRTTESLVTILENLASTVDNLNATTRRVNALLDEVEEPLRRLMPQMGAAMGAVATLGEAAGQLVEMGKRLSPLTVLAENAGSVLNMRPGRSAPAAAEPPPPPPGPVT
jgi:hypothetical protein